MAKSTQATFLYPNQATIGVDELLKQTEFLRLSRLEMLSRYAAALALVPPKIIKDNKEVDDPKAVSMIQRLMVSLRPISVLEWSHTRVLFREFELASKGNDKDKRREALAELVSRHNKFKELLFNANNLLNDTLTQLKNVSDGKTTQTNLKKAAIIKKVINSLAPMVK